MNTHSAHSPYQISCVGLEWRTEASLKTVLDVIRDRTLSSWQYTDDSSSAQVILYDSSNALAQAMLRRAEAGSNSRVFIPCGTGNTEDPEYLRLPVGATQMLSLLDRVTQRLEGSGTAAMAQVPLSQKLDEALHKKDILGVAIMSGQLVGFLAPKQKAIYWPKPLDADQIAHMLIDGLKVLAFTSNDKDLSKRFLQHSEDMVGWDATLWSIAASTATPRLSRHINPQQAYQITRWPDFGPIGRKSTDIKFVSLLSQRPYSPLALAEVPGFTSALAAKYFNASALCGILETAQPETSERGAGTAAAISQSSLVSNLMRGLRRAFALEAT